MGSGTSWVRGASSTSSSISSSRLQGTFEKKRSASGANTDCKATLPTMLQTGRNSCAHVHAGVDREGKRTPSSGPMARTFQRSCDRQEDPPSRGCGRCSPRQRPAGSGHAQQEAVAPSTPGSHRRPCRFPLWEAKDEVEVSESMEPITKGCSVWRSLCQIFAAGCRGGDGRCETSALKPVLAWRIRSSQRRLRLYNAAKAAVASDIEASIDCMDSRCIQTETGLDRAAAVLGREDSVNERFLLHAAKPETLGFVLQIGFLPYAGPLGYGIYLAEDTSQIEHSCTPDHGGALGELHGKMYSEAGVEHPGCVSYAIVARAILGVPAHTKDATMNLEQPSQGEAAGLFAGVCAGWELAAIPGTSPPVHYHTLVAERCQCREGSTPSRKQEFVVFNADRVLSEYVVAFRREDGPPQLSP